MKKFFPIILVLLTVLFLSSCGSGGEAATKEPAKGAASAPETTEEPAEEGDSGLTSALLAQAKEGVTLHVTVYKNGEEQYSYDYAIQDEKHCADWPDGVQTATVSYDIYRFVFNPDLYDMPIRWTGAPNNRGGLDVSSSFRNFVLFYCSVLNSSGTMEFEGDTYYYEDIVGNYQEMRLLYKDGVLTYVVPIEPDGSLSTDSSGGQTVWKITAVESGVDETLFDLPEGLELWSSNY